MSKEPITPETPDQIQGAWLSITQRLRQQIDRMLTGLEAAIEYTEGEDFCRADALEKLASAVQHSIMAEQMAQVFAARVEREGRAY